eukprot:759187-Hanusia_phi.AAC.2
MNEESLHVGRVKRLKKNPAQEQDSKKDPLQEQDHIEPRNVSSRASQYASTPVPHICLDSLSEDCKHDRLEIRSAGSQRVPTMTPRCMSARGQLLRCRTPRHEPGVRTRRREQELMTATGPKRGCSSAGCGQPSVAEEFED